MQPHEFDTLDRLINYLELIQDPHHKTSELLKRQSDFKMFYSQYDLRRGKSFEDTFPRELVDFYNSISVVDLKFKQELVLGDATIGYHSEQELDLIRKKIQAKGD